MLRKDLTNFTKPELQQHIESTLWLYICVLCGICTGLGYYLYDNNPEDSLIAGIIIAVVVWKVIAEKPFSNDAAGEDEN